MLFYEEIEAQFAALEGGDYAAKEALIETIWANYTKIARHPEVQPVLNRIFQWADEHASEHPDFYVFVLLVHGTHEFLRDRFTEGEEFIIKARELFAEKNDKDGIAAASILLGFIHRSRGELDMAMKNGLAGMEQLAMSGEYKMVQILGCYWIGSLYTETEHLNEALRIFYQGLNVDFPPGVQSMEARLISGIAGVYMKQKKYDLALEYFQKALNLSDDYSEKTFRSRGLTDIGDYYLELGDYDKALKYNQEALEMRREMNIQNACVTNLINIGRIYYKMGKSQEAIVQLEEALSLAHEIKVLVKIFPIHLLLSIIYEERGDIAESLHHYKTFHEVKEKVNHEDLERKVQNQLRLFQAEQISRENVIIKEQKLEIENAKRRSDELLHNILPEEVADELKSKGHADARQYDQVTVMFTDVKGFSGISEKLTPQELVSEMDSFFKAYDLIIDKYNIEKIKTIGDSYMCAGGLPVVNSSHAVDVVRAAMEIQEYMNQQARLRKAEGKVSYEIRIGVHTGPVVAGIVGVKKFAYDIWGDTVNIASRMESSGEPGRVNISAFTYGEVKDIFRCTYRGKIHAKNKGEIDMYFVDGEV